MVDLSAALALERVCPEAARDGCRRSHGVANLRLWGHRVSVGAGAAGQRGPARVPWTTCLLKRRTFNIRTPFGNQTSSRRGGVSWFCAPRSPAVCRFGEQRSRSKRARHSGRRSWRSSSVRDAPYENQYRKRCALAQHVRSANRLTHRRQTVDGTTVGEGFAHVCTKEAKCRRALSRVASVWRERERCLSVAIEFLEDTGGTCGAEGGFTRGARH